MMLKRGQEILKVCGLAESPVYRSLMHTEANCHLAKTEYLEALAIHHQILTKIADPERAPLDYARSLLSVARIQVAIDVPETEVQRTLEEVKPILLSFSSSLGPTLCNTVVAAMELRSGNYAAARKLSAQCLAVSWGSCTEVVIFCLEQSADVQRWRQEYLQQSSRDAVVLLGLGLKTHKRLATHRALRYLGDAFLWQNDPDTACSLQEVALAGFDAMDVHQERAECLLQLGNIVSERNQVSAAVKHWEESLYLFQRAAQEGRANFVREKIAAAKKMC
ncbi:hypothetical protein C8F01DRAFT_1129893, partial [Mycena amicta]